MVRKIQTSPEQPDIIQHDKSSFEAMINEGLRCGGLHLVSDKGHGKSRLLFSIAEYCRSLPDSRVLIFDGSDSWLYGFSQIPTFNINNEDITARQTHNILENESYSLNNWEMVKLALNSHDDLLFRLRTRSPSKRGFFIRTVINYLDDIQRTQIELSPTNTPDKQICYFIEEAQDAFNSRSTMRTETETFLTVFNESRNQRQSFFTASQRLSDFSKTIRVKQTYLIGKLNSEDITPQLRRLEKQYNLNLTETPLRTWYFKGETLVSPNWVQNKKPFIINAEIRKEYFKASSTEQPFKMPASKKLGFWQKILTALAPQTTTQSEDDKDDDEKENQEMDDMFLLDPLNP